VFIKINKLPITVITFIMLVSLSTTERIVQ